MIPRLPDQIVGKGSRVRRVVLASQALLHRDQLV